MIRALREAGIPIDRVGGVSIGAFMGALWCQENDLTTMTQKAREWSFVSVTLLLNSLKKNLYVKMFYVLQLRLQYVTSILYFFKYFNN